MIMFLMAVLLGVAAWNLRLFIKSANANTLISRITLANLNDERRYSRGVIAAQFAEINSSNSKRFRRVLFELPDFIDLLSVALGSGESVFNSVRSVTDRAHGTVAKEFRNLLRSVELGSTFEEELVSLSERLPQRQVVELCSKLALALRRGTALSKLLQEQSQSVRLEIQNQISRQAGRNETRMMIPLVFLILPITVLFAIYPSVQLLNIQSI